jgi:hypothetical protein
MWAPYPLPLGVRYGDVRILGCDTPSVIAMMSVYSSRADGRHKKSSTSIVEAFAMAKTQNSSFE